MFHSVCLRAWFEDRRFGPAMPNRSNQAPLPLCASEHRSQQAIALDEVMLERRADVGRDEQHQRIAAGLVQDEPMVGDLPLAERRRQEEEAEEAEAVRRHDHAADEHERRERIDQRMHEMGDAALPARNRFDRRHLGPEERPDETHGKQRNQAGRERHVEHRHEMPERLIGDDVQRKAGDHRVKDDRGENPVQRAGKEIVSIPENGGIAACDGGHDRSSSKASRRRLTKDAGETPIVISRVRPEKQPQEMFKASGSRRARLPPGTAGLEPPSEPRDAATGCMPRNSWRTRDTSLPTLSACSNNSASQSTNARTRGDTRRFFRYATDTATGTGV